MHGRLTFDDPFQDSGVARGQKTARRHQNLPTHRASVHNPAARGPSKLFVYREQGIRGLQKHERWNRATHVAAALLGRGAVDPRG